MERFLNDRYKMKDFDTRRFYELGFKRQMPFILDDECFTYKFPVLKFKKTPILWCRILVDKSCDVMIDVVNNNNEIYPPWYQLEAGVHTDIVEKINKHISKEFKKLGIVKVKRGCKA